MKIPIKKIKKEDLKNGVVGGRLGALIIWIYGLAIGNFLFWIPIFNRFLLFNDYTSMREVISIFLISLIEGLILGFFGFILGIFIINYFEKNELSKKRFLKWILIFYLFVPIILFMNLLAYLFILLILIILSIIYMITYSKKLCANNGKDKFKKTLIFFLVFLQVVGILSGLAYVITDAYLDVHGEVPSIKDSKIFINTSSNCLHINDYYQGDYGKFRPIHISTCNMSKKIRIQNHTIDYEFKITSFLKYEHGKIFTTIDGETFYATSENNFTMIIPIEFNDGDIIIAKINLYIEHIDYDYIRILFLSFTPGILLIIVLIFYKIKTKYIKE